MRRPLRRRSDAEKPSSRALARASASSGSNRTVVVSLRAIQSLYARPATGRNDRSPPLRQASFDQSQRRLDHLGHRLGVSHSLAGQGEGGSVVDGGAEEREAEGPVGGEAEGGGLHRDQPLVVVEGEHPIELAAARAGKERIGALR